MRLPLPLPLPGLAPRHLVLLLLLGTTALLLATAPPASASASAWRFSRGTGALNDSSSSSHGSDGSTAWVQSHPRPRPHPRDFDSASVHIAADVGAPPLLSPGGAASTPANTSTCAHDDDDRTPQALVAPASTMAQMCPAKSMDNPMRPALTHTLFHPDAEDLERQRQRHGAASAIVASSSSYAAPAAACPAYDASRFKKQPRAAQRWWAAQKKKDRASYGGQLPRSGVRSVRFPRAPRWVTYVCCGGPDDDDDDAAHLPTPAQLRGNVTVLNLAFFELQGPAGQLARFFEMPVEARVRYLNAMHSANVSVMMSTFGGDAAQAAVTLGYDPAALGRLHGSVVRDAGLDGLDNDLEDFDASEGGAQRGQSRTVAEWIVRYTRAVREALPRDAAYALSAAPIAPWFTTNETTYCAGGLYRRVEREAGAQIDWYNLQYYNQGKGVFEDCETILRRSNFPKFEETAVLQIAERGGVDLQKLVIGKPGGKADADDGYVPPGQLARCVAQAKSKGWKAGVMSFEWPSANAKWFQAVRRGYYA